MHDAVLRCKARKGVYPLSKIPPNPIWESRPSIDLRWEVSASPTEEMWEAMRSTSIGMADFGEDPAVRELEAFGAELSGHEAALLVPTVTVGTLLSLQAGARPGSVVLMEERAHIYWVEEMHVSAICGAAPRLLPGDKFGAIALDELSHAIDQEFYGHPARTSLVCLENTHNICGGTILTPEYISSVSELCRDRDIKLYLDGARLFNAAVALGRPLSHLCSLVDYAVIGLNKGLGAPFGSLLCGSRSFIEESKIRWRRLGSMGMHKAGIYAAACLVALQKMVDRLAEDHARARRLAEELQEVPGLRIDLDTVQTNLIRVETPDFSSQAVASALAQRSIAIHAFEPNAFKLATHLEIDDSQLSEVVAAFTSSMQELRESGDPPSEVAISSKGPSFGLRGE